MEIGQGSDTSINSTVKFRRWPAWYLWGPTLGLIGFLKVAALCVLLAGVTAAQFARPRIVSPVGRYEVRVYSDDCGATCPFHTNVVLRDRSVREFPPILRNFVDNDATVGIDSSTIRPCDIYPYWDDTKTLVIAIDGPGSGDDVYSQRTTWKDVTVRYARWDADIRREVQAVGCDDMWKYPPDTISIDWIARLGGLALATGAVGALTTLRFGRRGGCDGRSGRDE